MGIKSSSQQRLTAKSAISSTTVSSANPAGGIILTGQGLTANTSISQQADISSFEVDSKRISVSW
jgi:hypothetical protein